MCVYSMIMDHYKDKWPDPFPDYSKSIMITKEMWEEYQELKRKAIEYDKLTNQPDCEKQEALEWEKRMEDFLKKKGIL